jgi:hypothetical protein
VVDNKENNIIEQNMDLSLQKTTTNNSNRNNLNEEQKKEGTELSIDDYKNQQVNQNVTDMNTPKKIIIKNTREVIDLYNDIETDAKTRNEIITTDKDSNYNDENDNNDDHNDCGDGDDYLDMDEADILILQNNSNEDSLGLYSKPKKALENSHTKRHKQPSNILISKDYESGETVVNLQHGSCDEPDITKTEIQDIDNNSCEEDRCNNEHENQDEENIPLITGRKRMTLLLKKIQLLREKKDSSVFILSSRIRCKYIMNNFDNQNYLIIKDQEQDTKKLFREIAINLDRYCYKSIKNEDKLTPGKKRQELVDRKYFDEMELLSVQCLSQLLLSLKNESYVSTALNATMWRKYVLLSNTNGNHALQFFIEQRHISIDTVKIVGDLFMSIGNMTNISDFYVYHPETIDDYLQGKKNDDVKNQITKAKILTSKNVSQTYRFQFTKLIPHYTDMYAYSR